MPVIKKRLHLMEILDIAVEQRKEILHTNREILQRPASIWFRREDTGPYGDDVDVFYFKCLPAKYHNLAVKISRFCERVIQHEWTAYLRILLLAISFVFMAHQAPKLSSENPFPDNSQGHLFEFFEVLMSCCFLLDSLLRIGGIYIRMEIDNAYLREISISNIIMHSGVIDMILTVTCAYEGVTDTGQWLRFFRLLFLTSTAFELFPHLDVLNDGISNGLRSVFFTVLILSMLILAYASFGNYFFAENDPFNFGTYGMSVLTFYRLSTFEGWVDVSGVNYAGCDAFPSWYTEEALHEAEEVETTFGVFQKPFCENPQAQPVLASIVFISFELLAAYVIVSMSLASVIIGISERLESFKEERLKELEQKHAAPVHTSSKGSKKGTEKVKTGLNAKAKKLMDHNTNEERLLIAMIHKIWEGHDGVAAHAKAEMQRVRKGDFSDLSLKSIALDVEFMISHHSYQALMLLWIIADAALQIHDQNQRGEVSASSHAGHWVLQVGFMLDASLRLLSHLDKEADFVKDKWNVFDAAITVVMFVPLCGPELESARCIGALRLVRLARLLKICSFILELRVVLAAIASSFRCLLYVASLIIVFFFYASIVAILLFKVSDPYHFSNFGTTLLTLFRVMTLDLWSEVLRTCMFGCKHFGFETGIHQYDERCDTEGVGVGWWAPIFFAPFLIMSAQVLISLLIGVIITSMELLREGAIDEKEIWAKVEVVKKKYQLDSATLNMILQLFERLDKREKAGLSYDEIGPLFHIGEIPEDDQFKAFMTVDSDKSGRIDFAEFCEMISLIGIERRMARESERLAVGGTSGGTTGGTGAGLSVSIKGLFRRSIAITVGGATGDGPDAYASQITPSPKRRKDLRSLVTAVTTAARGGGGGGGSFFQRDSRVASSSDEHAAGMSGDPCADRPSAAAREETDTSAPTNTSAASLASTAGAAANAGAAGKGVTQTQAGGGGRLVGSDALDDEAAATAANTEALPGDAEDDERGLGGLTMGDKRYYGGEGRGGRGGRIQQEEEVQLFGAAELQEVQELGLSRHDGLATGVGTGAGPGASSSTGTFAGGAAGPGRISPRLGRASSEMADRRSEARGQSNPVKPGAGAGAGAEAEVELAAGPDSSAGGGGGGVIRTTRCSWASEDLQQPVSAASAAAAATNVAVNVNEKTNAAAAATGWLHSFDSDIGRGGSARGRGRESDSDGVGSRSESPCEILNISHSDPERKPMDPLRAASPEEIYGPGVRSTVGAVGTVPMGVKFSQSAQSPQSNGSHVDFLPPIRNVKSLSDVRESCNLSERNGSGAL